MTNEQLDRVYRDYFQSQAPAQLPPIVLAEPARTARPARDSGRSRLTLAAAVAALLGLGMLLSANLTQNRASSEPRSNFFKDAQADGGKLRDAMQHRHQLQP